MHWSHHAQVQELGSRAGGQPDPSTAPTRPSSGAGGWQAYTNRALQFRAQPNGTAYSSPYQSADSGAPCTAECVPVRMRSLVTRCSRCFLSLGAPSC